MAMAPPFGLTCGASSARPRSRVTARPCAAKASLSSMTSICSIVRPVRASTFLLAGEGPKPMMRGARPAVAMPSTRARFFKPKRSAAAAEASKIAQAPSLTPEALPAVTLPSGRTTPFSLASISMVVSGRGCSSVSTIFGSPFFCASTTGTISWANTPAAWAAAQRCWLRTAKASWSARLTANCSATFSAVSGMLSMPYLAFISGLTKRQPMVVSSILAARE